MSISLYFPASFWSSVGIDIYQKLRAPFINLKLPSHDKNTLNLIRMTSGKETA